MLASLCSARHPLASMLLIGVVLGGSSLAVAKPRGGGAATRPVPGHIPFDYPDAPPATVEIDLGHGLINDLLGLGDAAVTGLLQGLASKAQGNDAENLRFFAEQIGALRVANEIARDSIHEVHVRIYDGLPEAGSLGQAMAEHYDQKLRDANWESAVKVRQGDKTVRVSLVRQEEAIRGVFVCIADGNDLVLANATGDISPENVRELTIAIGQSGGKLGLQRAINKVVAEMKREIAKELD